MKIFSRSKSLSNAATSKHVQQLEKEHMYFYFINNYTFKEVKPEPLNPTNCEIANVRHVLRVIVVAI